MDDSVYVGNAGKDAALDRGWLLGHFKDTDDPRHSEAVEIKWGVHPRGDERLQWVRGEERTALLVLISGRFRVELPGRSVLLQEQGDFVVWGHGVDHSWFAEEESVVLTVRWPSVPGYAVTQHEEAHSPEVAPVQRDLAWNPGRSRPAGNDSAGGPPRPERCGDR
ncbi:signal peptidase I [Streptosporangium canum]|uniref:signal peptidase I n=1 Tax=Streptosporangium canum TaxID=324952 RepID=UPI001FE46EF6|nr:signal peptidase I [Streptosporangium canum]